MQNEVLEGYRLSPQQRRLWLLSKHDWNAPYQTKCAIAITGPVEIDHLKQAMQNVIGSHEILRTTYQCFHGMAIPVQVIQESDCVSWREDDLSGLGESELLIERFFHMPAQPFDLIRGPLLQLHLLKRAVDDYVMIVRLPALCADAMSMRNLVREISRNYATAVSAKGPIRDVAQYADLAEWQNELIEAEETLAGKDYWGRQDFLHSFMPRLAFESFSTNGADFEPRLEELEVALPLTAQVETLAQSIGTSPQQILLACWYILLWRHTGQSHIEVGAAFDGRRAEEIEGALGLFAKYLPITCHLSGELQFNELIKKIEELTVDVRGWQEYFSWERFIEPTANEPRAPFFPFCFESATSLASCMTSGVSFTILKQYACIDRFKIKLAFTWRPDRLVVEFHYDSALFRPADVRCLLEQFKTLLDGVSNNPTAKIGELQLLAFEGRHESFLECNSAKTEWPRDTFIHELFSEQVACTPESVAVVCKQKRLTYRELDERAVKLAQYLRGLGIGPETIVGLALERSIDLVIGLMAVLKAGGAYLPLDPSYPQARLSSMLEDAGITVLLTETRLLSSLPPVDQIRI